MFSGAGLCRMPADCRPWSTLPTLSRVSTEPSSEDTLWKAAGRKGIFVCCLVGYSSSVVRHVCHEQTGQANAKVCVSESLTPRSPRGNLSARSVHMLGPTVPLFRPLSFLLLHFFYVCLPVPFAFAFSFDPTLCLLADASSFNPVARCQLWTTSTCMMHVIHYFVCCFVRRIGKCSVLQRDANYIQTTERRQSEGR